MKSSPNLLVDMIPVNNARHSDEERASGGHFTDGASQEMVLKYTSNFTGGCNFSQVSIKNEHISSSLKIKKNYKIYSHNPLLLCVVFVIVLSS